MLTLLLALHLHATPPPYDDASLEGFHYHCSNLKGALVLTPDGGAKFVFPEAREVRTAEPRDKDIVPPGRGGRLLMLNAWAAGTIVRVPDEAFAGVASYRQPWSNWSYMGHGSARGIGVCTLVTGREN